MDIETDLYGNALVDFHKGNYSGDIKVLSTTMEDDLMPLPYLFRSYDQMPALEKKALLLSTGTVLDVGAGAGSHSLYLESNGLNVTAIDQSPGAITVLKERLKSTDSKIVLQSIWQHKEKYDTILLLMNGTGIFEKLSRATSCLEYLKNLLNKNGQILIDSSDLRFLYEDEEDGGLWVDSSKEYYGEVTFSLQYKGTESAPFNWLYMDFELLKTHAQKAGLKAELVHKGEHYDYLARLTRI